jgi:hypothetical protein
MLQTLLTGLILLAAISYLSLRYLPLGLKKSMRTAVGKRSPRLAAYFSAADGACGSGCGSCNSCDTVSASNNKKVIRIIPQRD